VKSDVREQLGKILSQYSAQSSSLLPILQEAQERFGYLSGEVLQGIAGFMRLAGSTVYGVVTFYSHFRLSPEGKNVVKVCQGPACCMLGGRQILCELEEQLGIKLGETTGDQKYSLEGATCSGPCALAPVVEVNGKIYGNMTPARVKDILADIE